MAMSRKHETGVHQASVRPATASMGSLSAMNGCGAAVGSHLAERLMLFDPCGFRTLVIQPRVGFSL